MDEVVDEFVAGNGFIPGMSVDEPEQIDLNDPCKGAVPRVHSHFFTEDGEFGSRDWKGEDVDFGRYRVMGDRLVISKEFPDVTFRFSVEGDTLTLEPLNIPAGCTEFRCGWAIAVASPARNGTASGSRYREPLLLESAVLGRSRPSPARSDLPGRGESVDYHQRETRRRLCLAVARLHARC